MISVAFSPDGKRLASASWEQTVILSDLDPCSWVKRARSMVNRARTSGGRHKYVGDITHKPTCADLD